MHFIFSKRTRRIVTSILNKQTDEEQRTSEGPQKVAAPALAKAYEIGRALPILSFDEDGDIGLPQRVIDAEEERCRKLRDVARNYARQHNLKLPNYIPEYDRRGVVIASPVHLSPAASDTSLTKSPFQTIKATLKNIIFSQFGVGCLVILYVILGGLMFDAIESSNEYNVKARQKGNRDQLIDRLRRTAEDLFNFELNNSFEIKYAHWRDYMRYTHRREVEWKMALNSDLWAESVLKELAQYEHKELEAGYKDTKDQEELQTEVWTVTSAMLYSATVITTIGYGNITPKTIQGKILTMIYALFGIPLMFICLSNTGDVLANIFIKVYSKAVNSFCITCCNERFRKIAGYSSEDLSEADDTTNQHAIHRHVPKKHVPIFATLCALAIYIFGGALLFGSWEKWHVVDGAYFCFITFTTIGFGDFVPGQGIVNENKSGKMLLCAAFLLIGMIVMAMCFKLMQDELVAKIREIGRKLGFIDVHN